MRPSPWLIRRPTANTRLRLYCFSYAGGSAATYAGWQQAMPPGVEVCAVQLPGRGMRLGEAPYTSLPALIETLAAVLREQDAVPYAFFGHSLGALVAFELAHYCRQHGMPAPAHLFVSGGKSPRQRGVSKQYHTFSDARLIETLRELNGTPPRVLEDKELMALILPMIRADFTLVDKYQYTATTPLDVNITALVGSGDPCVCDPTVAAWAQETRAACAVRWFDGDHFFIDTCSAAVLEFMRGELEPVLRGLARPAPLQHSAAVEEV